MNSLNKLPKFEKFLLLSAVFSGLCAVLVISAQIVSAPISQTTQAQKELQTVRSWNIDKTKENWISHNTKDATVKNGSMNIRLGKNPGTSFIFNRKALTKLTSAGKYLTMSVAFRKDNQQTQTSPSNTPQNEQLTKADTQIINLPIAAPSIGDPGVCTADLIRCADGSSVGRVPPACDFRPCPNPPFPAFEFKVYIKKLDTAAWSQPIPVTGKIDPEFHDYFVKLPDTVPLIIEALKIEFSSGLVPEDIILIDKIELLQEKTSNITGNPPNPTTIISPLATRWPSRPPYRTPAPDICTPRPPCADGIVDAIGNRVYCMPPRNTVWCPVPQPTIWIDPRPTTSACVPYPDNCIQWNNGKPTMICRFVRAENWCPLPLCRPRPSCLNSNPRCMIAETPDMCPPGNPGIDVPPPRYTETDPSVSTQ